ncbi:hypothetical protein [Enterococcus faecalis]|uniref:hypothetical protein n=1 Tax=Enterococcus faecalis TaxID=1351 RepID=UPI0040416FDE
MEKGMTRLRQENKSKKKQWLYSRSKLTQQNPLHRKQKQRVSDSDVLASDGSSTKYVLQEAQTEAKQSRS